MTYIRPVDRKTYYTYNCTENILDSGQLGTFEALWFSSDGVFCTAHVRGVWAVAAIDLLMIMRKREREQEKIE